MPANFTDGERSECSERSAADHGAGSRGLLRFFFRVFVMQFGLFRLLMKGIFDPYVL